MNFNIRQKEFEDLIEKTTNEYGEDQAGKESFCMSCSHQRVTSFGETTYCILNKEERINSGACVEHYRGNPEKGVAEE